MAPRPPRTPVHRGPRHSPAGPIGGDATAPEGSRERFLDLDRYRVEREWQRYQGTPQRDLFRTLRERFLRRHAVNGGWAIEIGPGPGRFSPLIGGAGSRRLLLDLSLEMLRKAREVWPKGPDLPVFPGFVRGDGTHPPIRPGTARQLVALGNPLGFSGDAAGQFLEAALDLLAPGGTFLVETVAGGGERSRYLSRLPPKAVQRLLVAPVMAVRPRVEREGFAPLGDPDPDRHGFRRFGASELLPALEERGLEVTEVVAVASMLGSEQERIAAVRSEPAAWSHLLELEEIVGRAPARHRVAAALLVAARRPPVQPGADFRDGTKTGVPPRRAHG
ncbi:MAG: class I SAM-dependent methyltransferase [Thermoplasmata archaeon]|nr:class I SAM-dependent methyltransferase [Thermoplasmata archaeon]